MRAASTAAVAVLLPVRTFYHSLTGWSTGDSLLGGGPWEPPGGRHQRSSLGTPTLPLSVGILVNTSAAAGDAVGLRSVRSADCVSNAFAARIGDDVHAHPIL